MDKNEGIDLLVFSFDLDTLIIQDTNLQKFEQKTDITAGSTYITDLFILRNRDISYFRDNEEFIFLFNTISRNDEVSHYLLSIKQTNKKDRVVCTVIPRDCSGAECHLADELLKKIEDGQYELFNPLLPSPLFILDLESTIRSANKQMFDMFEVNEVVVCGVNFGNVFKCSSAEDLKQRCGTFTHCLNCNLRNGIKELLEGRLSTLQADTDFEYITENGSEIMRISVTAAAIEYSGIKYIAVSFIRLS